MSNARRQHYVWQKYLEPWEREGKLWCRRGDGDLFNTGTANVAVERDFYALRNITEGDLEFVQQFAIEPIKNETLRRMNHGWIDTFEKIFKVDGYARNHPKSTPELIKKLNVVLNSIEESNLSRIETNAKKFLDALTQGDSAFYYEDSTASQFCFFLANQYFRTKKIRDAVRNQFSATPLGEAVDRTWPILRQIYTTSVAFSMYVERRLFKMSIIEVDLDQGVEFITCDQPVMNTYAAFTPNVPVTEMEFYYPVSPAKAMVLSQRNSYVGMHVKFIDKFRATYLNQIVERSAYEWLFASRESSLNASPLPGSLA